jgi:hypothetical protein
MTNPNHDASGLAELSRRLCERKRAGNQFNPDQLKAFGARPGKTGPGSPLPQ